MLWASHEDCGNADVLYLIVYLQSKNRDCHVNTGVHGEVNADGKFKFRWDRASDIFYGQDFENADPLDNRVSLHEITSNENGPIYHAGVDTIDGFCKSWHKELTEAELDDAYVRFCELHPGAALEKEVIKLMQEDPP